MIALRKSVESTASPTSVLIMYRPCANGGRPSFASGSNAPAAREAGAWRRGGVTVAARCGGSTGGWYNLSWRLTCEAPRQC